MDVREIADAHVRQLGGRTGGKRGSTELHMAAHGGSTALVRFLHDYWSTTEPLSPTHIARLDAKRMQRDHETRQELRRLALKSPPIQQRLDRTAVKGMRESFWLDETDEDGLSPLMSACAAARPDVVEELLKLGALPGGVKPASPEQPSLEESDDLDVLMRRDAGEESDLDSQDEDGRRRRIGPVGHATALHFAVRGAFGARNERCAQLLLQHGADVNAPDSFERTTLHWACLATSIPATRLLLERGADLEARDWQGRTPLSVAVQARSSALVRVLLSAGANCNAIDRDGETVLNVAICEDTTPGFDSVSVLLGGGALPRAPGRGGHTPMTLAATFGLVPVVKMLLEKGGSADDADEGGMTALHWAARNGHAPVARLLLDHARDAGKKPDVNRFDKAMRTALDYAEASQHAKCRQVKHLLRGRGGRPSAFYLDSITKIQFAVRNWLQRRQHAATSSPSPPERRHVATSRSKASELRAVHKPHPPPVSAVKAARANAWALPRRSRYTARVGNTGASGDLLSALARLVVEGAPVDDISRALSRHADVNAIDPWGASPLHVAALFDRPAHAARLIEAGAVVGRKDGKGYTPLHYAVCGRSLDTLDHLLTNGARLYAIDSRGRQALHMAAICSAPQMLRALLSKGMEKNGFDFRRATPLHYACQVGSMDAVKVLLDAGASPAFIDNDGQSALAIAARNSKTPALAELVQQHMPTPSESPPVSPTATTASGQLADMVGRKGASPRKSTSQFILGKISTKSTSVLPSPPRASTSSAPTMDRPGEGTALRTSRSVGAVPAKLKPAKHVAPATVGGRLAPSAPPGRTRSDSHDVPLPIRLSVASSTEHRVESNHPAGKPILHHDSDSTLLVQPPPSPHQHVSLSSAPSPLVTLVPSASSSRLLPQLGSLRTPVRPRLPLGPRPTLPLAKPKSPGAQTSRESTSRDARDFDIAPLRTARRIPLSPTPAHTTGPPN